MIWKKVLKIIVFNRFIRFISSVPLLCAFIASICIALIIHLLALIVGKKGVFKKLIVAIDNSKALEKMLAYVRPVWE